MSTWRAGRSARLIGDLPVLKFLFGGGWWTAWYVVFWAGSLMFVILPLVMIIRDAVPKPAGPASLGSVVLTMGIAGFLGVVTLVDGITAARMAGQGWWTSLLIALVASGVATFLSYAVMVKVCTDGGYGWSTAACIVCGATMLGNLAALSYGRAGDQVVTRRAAPAVLSAEG